MQPLPGVPAPERESQVAPPGSGGNDRNNVPESEDTPETREQQRYAEMRPQGDYDTKDFDYEDCVATCNRLFADKRPPDPTGLRI